MQGTASVRACAGAMRRSDALSAPLIRGAVPHAARGRPWASLARCGGRWRAMGASGAPGAPGNRERVAGRGGACPRRTGRARRRRFGGDERRRRCGRLRPRLARARTPAVRRHVRCADCRCDRAGNVTFGAQETSRSVRQSCRKRHVRCADPRGMCLSSLALWGRGGGDATLKRREAGARGGSGRRMAQRP